MRRPHEQMVREERGRAKTAFTATTDPQLRAYVGHPAALEEHNRINAQADAERQRTNDLFDKEYKDRLAREKIRVWEEGSQPTPRGPSPSHGQNRNALSDQSITAEADARVRLAHSNDLQGIERAREERLSGLQWEVRQERRAIRSREGIPQSQSVQPPVKENMMAVDTAPPHFKAELHRIIDEAKSEQYLARRAFSNEREELIARARDAGAAEPEKEVSRMFREKLDDLYAKQHRAMDSLCIKYGWDRDEKLFVDHAREPIRRDQDIEQNRAETEASRALEVERQADLRASLDQAIDQAEHDQGDQSQ